LLASAALEALLLGCGPSGTASQQPSAPEGAVLLVDEQPLRARDVAELQADVAALFPEYSATHALRLALTNEFLPRLATRSGALEAWQRARAACAGADPASLEPETIEGGYRGLGLGLWSAARHLAPGSWSGALELTGRWVRLRLDGRTEAADPRAERLRLSVLEFPFIEPATALQTVEASVDRARLRILDGRFGEAIPEIWKHRMRSGAP
jgi:hypothetical protein